MPPTVVTETSFEPTLPAGVTAVIKMDDTTTTLVAATPATVTLLAPVKPVPLMEIVVDPVSGPEVGLTEVMAEAMT